MILNAPKRAELFVNSSDYKILKTELDAKVKKYYNEILLASLIENVNVRGRIIEYLIAGQDEKLRNELVAALLKRKKEIPPFKTKNTVADFHTRLS